MSRQTQEERRRATRARLVDAAARVFARRGFAAASMEEIAAEAGHSTGAIYHHFAGKEDLFLAISAEFAADRVRELTDVIGDPSVDAAERARRAGDQWMERLLDDPRRFRLALEFRSYAQERPAVRAALADRVAAVRDATARQIEDDARAGAFELPLPAHELAAVTRALGIGLALERLTDPDAIRDGLFGDFLYVLFGALESGAVTPPPARSGPARRASSG